MRFARKLMLLAIAAIAAMAVFAPSASATETVEVVNERTATHCPAFTFSNDNPPVLTGGGCLVHAIGVATLRIDLGVFGEAFEATCNLEVLMRVNSTGSAYITAVNTTTGAGQEVGCPTVTTECSMPWAASGEEDGPVGVVQSSASVCIDPAESGSNCVGNLAFSIVEQADEHYETQFNNATVGLCELDVDLEIEDDEIDPVTGQFKYTQIHINHP